MKVGFGWTRKDGDRHGPQACFVPAMKVSVYNRTRDKAEVLAKEGAQAAASLAEVCRDSKAVFTMLSDDSAVERRRNSAKEVWHFARVTLLTFPPAHKHGDGSPLGGEHSRRGQPFLARRSSPS